MENRAFHLAFPVTDIDKTIDFYHRLLGCPVGRRASRWVDFNFFGNQITAHLGADEKDRAANNPVDGDKVPTRHFGAILEWPEWQDLADRLKKARVAFLIEPKIRFQGKPGEQGTFFVLDPSGNALEFKTFKTKSEIFSKGKNYDP